MAILAAWVPLTMMLLIYAAYIRLSARILKVEGLRWKKCVQLSLLFVVLILAIRAIIIIYGNFNVPVFIRVLMGVGLLLTGGTLFLARSVKSADGNAIGNSAGLKITALTIGLLSATGIVLFIAFELLNNLMFRYKLS